MGEQVAARDKREVGGSSPLKPTPLQSKCEPEEVRPIKPTPLQKHKKYIRGISSVGRAPALQAGGHEFESRILH